MEKRELQWGPRVMVCNMLLFLYFKLGFCNQISARITD